jgi:phage gp36-like protein
MGDYITEKDLNLSDAKIAYLSGSTDVTAPNRNILSRAIYYAEGRIKSSMGVRYELPVDDAAETALIKGIAQDIAIYRLYLGKEDDQIPEKVQNAYDDALEHLKLLRDGIINLGADTEDEDEFTENSPLVGTIERS